MTDLNLILAQAAADGGGSTLVFIFGTMLVFYFFIMRPQLKKQKEARKFRERRGPQVTAACARDDERGEGWAHFVLVTTKSYC